MLDRTGLIYLRARYYDPSVSRFIQIDNNYDGEQKSVSSQNRYVYTLNTPYKYVDRNGNSSIAKTVSEAMKKALSNAGNAIASASKKAKSAMASWVTNAMEIAKNALNKGMNVVVGAGSSNKSGNGGGTTKAKPKVKKVKAETKCPEVEMNKDRGVMTIDCTDITKNVGRSIFSREKVAVCVRDTGLFDAGYTGTIITEKIADLTDVYRKKNDVENINAIKSALGKVVGLFDYTGVIAEVISIDIPIGSPYGSYLVTFASDMQVKYVTYDGLPFIYHQYEKVYAGIQRKGTNYNPSEILIDVAFREVHVGDEYDIKDTSDRNLIRIGSTYYLRAQGPHSNFTYYSAKFKQSRYYTAKV